MSDIPTSFRSVEEAAEYVLSIHYSLQARNFIFEKTRQIDGTQIAAVMMAEKIVPLARQHYLQKKAQQKNHADMIEHALDILG